MATPVLIGRGTRVRVAPIGADRIFPETTLFETTALAAAEATTLAVSMTPATTRTIPASVDYPLYLTFTDPTGATRLAVVTADIAAGATASLTVLSLKFAIADESAAPFPVILSKRTSANLSDADAEVDVMTFDNDGWKDSVTTTLANGLELNGFYDPLDAGWNTCYRARLNFREIYCALEIKPPTGYTTGHIVKMFSGVKMPLDVPPDNIINANISLTSRGEVTFVDPA